MFATEHGPLYRPPFLRAPYINCWPTPAPSLGLRGQPAARRAYAAAFMCIFVLTDRDGQTAAYSGQDTEAIELAEGVSAQGTPQLRGGPSTTA